MGIIIITVIYNFLTLACRQMTKPDNILGSHLPLWSIIYVGEGKVVYAYSLNKVYKQINNEISKDIYLYAVHTVIFPHICLLN